MSMYGTGSGGAQSAVANIDVPEDSLLKGVQVAHIATLNADGEDSYAELSFIATTQGTTNDIRGLIAISRLHLGLLTSGAGAPHANFFIPMDLEIAGGERLYMHISASSGVNSSVNFVLHFMPKRGRVTRRSARRRQ